MRRSVAKNKDNWMITVRQSLVQSHFAVQSYPKEECGPICLISMGSFSLRSGALRTNFAILIMNGASTSNEQSSTWDTVPCLLTAQIFATFGCCWTVPVNSVTVIQKSLCVELRNDMVMGNWNGF